MKTIYTAFLCSAILLTTSCTEQHTPEHATGELPAQNQKAIVGRWKLTKEERFKSDEKGVEYANQPTNVILHLQNSGYFIIYDTFIDPEWKSKGLPLIQRRSKGQWKLAGKELRLTHLSDDSSYVERVEITSLDDDQLVTLGQDRKSNVYKTYGK
jgi:hypothetical protein